MKVWTIFEEVEANGNPDVLYTKIRGVSATRETAKAYTEQYFLNIKWHDYANESKGETALGNGQCVRLYISEHEVKE